MITSVISQWEVSGSVTGANSFGASDAIGHTLPVGGSFTGTKTLSVSTLLLMLSLTIV